MEKVPGYDCPHGHILYGKCLLCEREAQNEAPAISLDDQLALVTQQRDALLGVVKAVYYRDYRALPTYREIRDLIESVESTPSLAAKASQCDELLAALKTIAAAHKFNICALSPYEVHAICFNAIEKVKGGAA